MFRIIQPAHRRPPRRWPLPTGTAAAAAPTCGTAALSNKPGGARPPGSVYLCEARPPRGHHARTTLPVTPPAPPPEDALSVQALTTVVAHLGTDVAAPLTAALDRLQAIAQSGRLDRAGLQALRADIDSARRAGLLGQQIARLCAGQAHLVAERLNLATLLRQVLNEQAAQASTAPAMGSTEHLDDLMVLADPSLLATLLRGAASWGAAHARAPVVWRLGLPPDGGQAVLSCHVPLLSPQAQPAPAAVGLAGDVQPLVAGDGPRQLASLDTLDWLLMLCAARLAGVQVARDDQAAFSQLLLRLPRGSTDGVANAATGERTGGRLMAGSQVLVLSAGRESRQRVREAMNGHDVFIDSVASVAAAADYCDDGAPQVLIFESAFTSEALRSLCERLSQLQPGVALVELLPDGQDVEPGSFGTAPVTRLGVDALRQNLAPALARMLAAKR
jgi:hypothetical protein